jgi:hypothetical protein
MSPELANQNTTWTVVQVLFASIEARIQLLTAHRPKRLPSAASGGYWYFADVPIETAEGSYHGLEFAVQRRGENEDAALGLESWIHDNVTVRLSRTTSLLTEPTILSPELFAARWIPATYPAAVTIASRRACAILSGIAAAGETRASTATVRAELEAIYRAFLPNSTEARKVLETHAAWLETTHNHVCRKARLLEGADHAEALLLASSPVELEPYETAASSIQREIRSTIASKASRGGGTAHSKLLGALVARFAHIQAVRLWGPERPNAFLREAALLRSLSSESMAVQ